MATVAADISQPSSALPAAGDGQGAKGRTGGEELRLNYQRCIQELQLQIRHERDNLSRLEAQHDDLNSRVRMMREELRLLQEPGSNVGEAVKVMGKSKVLVKTAENREEYDRRTWRRAGLPESRGHHQAGNCTAPWQWRQQRRGEQGIGRRRGRTAWRRRASPRVWSAARE